MNRRKMLLHRAVLLLAFILGTADFACARYYRNPWHIYLAPTTGLMYYVGDLKKNSLPEFPYLHPTLGLQLSAHHGQLFVAQLSYTRGAISGYDTLVNEVLQRRGYEFFSRTHDIEAMFKLTLLNADRRMRPGSDPIVYPRLMAGMGMMRFNPTATYNGEQVELQKLGTSGQQLGLPGYPEPYSLWAFGLKLGGELCVQTGVRTSFSFYGYYTFAQTDYLDDVGGGPHIDFQHLSESENPGLLAEFAYARRLDRELQSTPQHTRGNPEAKDGYMYLGFSLAFRLTDDPILKRRARY